MSTEESAAEVRERQAITAVLREFAGRIESGETMVCRISTVNEYDYSASYGSCGTEDKVITGSITTIYSRYIR